MQDIIEKIKIDIEPCKEDNHGWIHFNIRFEDKIIKVNVSSVFDPFDELLQWLGNIIKGDRYCSFIIDEEGTTVEFKFISLFGKDIVRIYDSKQEVYIETKIDKYYFIREFYLSFANFYNSDEYNKKENEIYYVYEELEDAMARPIFEDTIDLMLGLDKVELTYLFSYFYFEKIKYDTDEDEETNFEQFIKYAKENHKDINIEDWIFKDFNKKTYFEKVHTLMIALYYGEKDVWFRLKDYKSDLIEDYLLRTVPADREYSYREIYFDFEDSDVFYEGKGIKVNVYIDGIKIFERYHLNLNALEYSLIKEGHHPLYTCFCGNEGCAGIFFTPFVQFEDGDIIWHFYEPKLYVFRFNKYDFKNALLDLKERMLRFKPIEEWKNVLYTDFDSVGHFLE